MKLEKAVGRPKTGLYIVLFILCLAIAGVMATSYNVEIIVNNLRENVRANMGAARGGMAPGDGAGLPWFKIILGSLGFVGIITALILFFARMIREMKISQFHADFLDRVSHELRTPLATMTLVSDLLKSDHELNAEERKRLWDSHDAELTRLKNDVESLLQAARLRESRQQVKMTELELRGFLEEKWPSFVSLLGPGAELRLDWGADPDRVFRVKADPQLLELILRNLLDNAKKFARGVPQVALKIHRTPKRFEITVADQGRGFTPSASQQLFKRFSRIQATQAEHREYSVPGTGLGLYLSASASRAMGMTLTGRSQGEGQGAEFVLSGDLA